MHLEFQYYLNTMCAILRVIKVPALPQLTRKPLSPTYGAHSRLALRRAHTTQVSAKGLLQILLINPAWFYCIFHLLSIHVFSVPMLINIRFPLFNKSYRRHIKQFFWLACTVQHSSIPRIYVRKSFGRKVRSYGELCRGFSNHPAILYHLGRTYTSVLDCESAAKLYSKVFFLSPFLCTPSLSPSCFEFV